MIFLDNASTTRPYAECMDIINKYSAEKYYNPSAPYHEALSVSKEIKEAREKILRLLVGEGKIVFTASGTESDNLALFGTKKPNGSRIVISQSEHPAVYNCAIELKQRGYDVVEAKTDKTGRVIVGEFENLVNENTALVSIMHVNNETGCINDIKTLCAIAKRKNPSVIFHSDGIQAVGKIRTNMRDLGVDLYSISAHKFHGLKGTGALFVKKGINLHPIMFGGGQEDNIRSATENVGGIMCLAYALERSISKLEENDKHVRILRNAVINGIDIDNIKVISDDNSSPYILSLALKCVRGEVMLHSLEKYGIMIGTGSACSTHKSSKRIPNLLRLPTEYENGIIRVSFNDFNTKDDIDYFIKQLNSEYKALYKYVRG